MTKRAAKFSIGAALVIALIAALGIFRGEALLMDALALRIETQSLEERKALLKDHLDIRLPQSGEAPFPTVVQFHGCAGVDALFQSQWADIANEAGYAAVIVDSNAARGYSRQQSLDLVCQGKALLGQERAGDVFAALSLIGESPALDQNRIVLSAWSHGGWAVMDFITMGGDRAPPGLSEPVTPPPVQGIALFYPYCGPGARARFAPWRTNSRILAFIAGADEVVDADQCLTLLGRRKAQGRPIQIVYYPDANHVFDDPFLEPDWIHLYNEQYFADAIRQYKVFLETLSHDGR